MSALAVEDVIDEAPIDEAPIDEALLARYSELLNGLRLGGFGLVEALTVSPEPDTHLAVPRLRVLPESGVEGQYPGKQWWQGRRVPGRQVSAVSADVLDVLGIAYDVPGDNLILRGLDLSRFAPGDALRLGDALLVVTPTPHRPCAKLARRTTLTKMRAISRGSFRGLLLDAQHPAEIAVGDVAERVVGV